MNEGTITIGAKRLGLNAIGRLLRALWFGGPVDGMPDPRWADTRRPTNYVSAALRPLVLAAACCCPCQAVSTIQFQEGPYRVSEAAGEVFLRVVRSNDVETRATVNYRTADITAKAGEDYAPAEGTVVFEPGETNQTVRILIANDAVREQPMQETFSATLVDPSSNAALGARANATVAIEDNDTGLLIEFPSYQAGEAAGSVVVAVIRGPDETLPATVEYGASALTAVAGTDFAETNGALHFAPEERVKLISIPIHNDGVRETDERFQITLRNATGNALGSRTSATITIVDNDPGVEFQVNQIWAHEDEGRLGVHVVRGNDGVLEPFSVPYNLTNLTATAGEDHHGMSGTLLFAAGEAAQTIWIPLVNDGTSEPDERLRIRLAEPTGSATLGRGTNLTCTVTICDTTGLEPNLIQAIRLTVDGRVRLDLKGGVPERFLPFYSLFQIEDSEDLVRWQGVRLAGHRNRSPNPPPWNEFPMIGVARQFYRLAASPLVSPSVPPTGPYAVGITRRLVTDPARRNRYDISTNGSFVVSIWYPANPRPGATPDPYEEKALAFNIQWQTPAWMDRAPRFSSYSFLDAPVRPVAGGYPVLIHSHGLSSARYENMERAEHLASHGYVVVAVNHPDAGIEVFPDGRLFSRAQTASGTAAGFQERILDMILTADKLLELNRNDPVLAGAINLDQIAASGFSWGAHTAAEFCRLDGRGKVAVSLDWGTGSDSTAPEIVRLGVQKPCLMLNASNNPTQVLFDRAAKDAYWIQISNTEHLNFHGYDWFTFQGSSEAREATRTITAYVLSFLNKHLKGEDEPLLDGPSPAYPRVRNFKKK